MGLVSTLTFPEVPTTPVDVGVSRDFGMVVVPHLGEDQSWETVVHRLLGRVYLVDSFPSRTECIDLSGPCRLPKTTGRGPKKGSSRDGDRRPSVEGVRSEYGRWRTRSSSTHEPGKTVRVFCTDW